MHPHFSIGEAIRFGWHKTRAHSALLFQTMLTLFAVQVASSIVDKTLGNSLEGVLASIALGVLSCFLGTGFMLIALRIAKSEHASYRDLLPHWRIVWHYFCASVVAGLLTFIPLLIGALVLVLVILSVFGVAAFSGDLGALLFMPPLAGIHPVVFVAAIAGCVYLMLRYSMVRFAVLELSHTEGAHSITNSLRKSTHLTKGVKGRLLGFVLALIGLNLLGALALLVGLLVTIPISALAYAHVYLKLKSRS